MSQFLIRAAWFLSLSCCAFVIAQPPSTETAEQLRARAEAKCKLAVQRFVRDKDAEASRKELEEVAKIDPSYAMPLFFLGTLAEEQKKPEEAILYYERFAALDTISDFYVQAQLRLDELKGRAKPAAPSITQDPANAAEPKPTSSNTPIPDLERLRQARSLSLQAEGLARAGKTEDAAAKFQEAYRLDPSDERSGLRAALAHGAVNKLGEAIVILRLVARSKDDAIAASAKEAMSRVEREILGDTSLLRAIAERGDAWAQRCMGDCYKDGRGLAKDELEAVKWYRLAADQGDPVAQLAMSVHYFYKRNPDEEVKWCRLAAEQGYAPAQSSLGFLYEAGRGVAKSDAEAIRWYRRAAEQGDASAQSSLGFAFAFGKGVPKDQVEAAKWLRLAGEQGDMAAQNKLGFCYVRGEGVASDTSEAIKWFRLAALGGHPEAQEWLRANGVSWR